MSESTPSEVTGTPATRSGSDLVPLVRWLLGITRPVHKPLLASACFRIVALSLDIALFATAAGVSVHLATGGSDGARWFAILVVLALAKATFFYLEQFSGHYVAFKALELLRTYVFARLWPKAPAVVSHARSGDLLTSLTRDVDRIEVVYAHTFAPVVAAHVVTPAAVIVAGLVVGWQPVAVAAVCAALSLFVVPYLGVRRSMRATRRTLALRRELTQSVTDTVFGIEEVVGYGREAARLDDVDTWGDRIAASARVPRDFSALRRGANVALMLGAAISIVASGASGSSPLSPVVLAALAAGALRVFEAPRGIEDATGYLDHSLAAARRLREIATMPERVVDGPDDLVGDHAPALTFTDVTYAYPDASGVVPIGAPDVVSQVSFDVPAGGHVMLVGRSGSGKSTLVQLLLRYDDPASGQITLDDVPVSRFRLDALRRNVVVVSQKNQMLDATLAENLRLGVPDASDDDLWQALETAGFADEVRAMPDGLATPVGRNGSALSGGQVQRACLARALVMHPRVLVLDEFTANLDAALEARIREALEQRRGEITIVEVTHRLEATHTADRVVVLDRGRVVADDPGEVFAATH